MKVYRVLTVTTAQALEARMSLAGLTHALSSKSQKGLDDKPDPAGWTKILLEMRGHDAIELVERHMALLMKDYGQTWNLSDPCEP